MMDEYDLLYEIRELLAEKQCDIKATEAQRGYQEPHLRDPDVAHSYGAVAALSTVLDIYTVHEQRIDQLAVQLVEDLRAAGVQREHVAAFIDNLKSDEAADINNGGLGSQVTFLLDAGWLEGAVRQELLRCKEEYEDTGDHE